MVEQADTGGLNPPSRRRECGFESHPGHGMEYMIVEVVNGLIYSLAVFAMLYLVMFRRGNG